VGVTAFTSGWTDNRQPIARTLGRTDAERGPARSESRLQGWVRITCGAASRREHSTRRPYY